MKAPFNRIIILFSILFLTISVFAQDKPSEAEDLTFSPQNDYYGERSYDLDDDTVLRNLKQELNNFTNTKKRLENEIAVLTREVQALNTQLSEVENQIRQCEARPTPECNAQIKQLYQRKETLTKSIEEKNGAIKTKTSEIERINGQITAKNSEIEQRRSYLITKINEFNRRGFQDSVQDGRLDGRILAGRIGYDFGRRDGEIKGEYDGKNDGFERDRQKGFEEGAITGKNEAEAKGKTNGTIDGRKEGNIIAALQDGEDEGRRQAEDSDAKTVGISQGKSDGFKRAESEGKINGEKKGEAEAVKKYETLPIKEVEDFGAFSGTFANDIPDFPSNFQGGENYRPYSPSSENALFGKAFVDGYRFGYWRTIRRSYSRNIEDFYYNEFNNYYRRSYDYFYNMFYAEARQEGFDEGRETNFNAIYPDVYNEYFNLNKEKFAASPDTRSPEYKANYEEQLQATYEEVYEQIRLQNYGIAERQVFAANIEQRTEEFRKKRFAEVVDVYENLPVLKFESVEIFDKGINGIAKDDGVFMPGEQTVQDVTIVNYGKKSATETQVSLSNGKTFTIKNLAPQTRTTIRGVSQSSIPNDATTSADFMEILTITASISDRYNVQNRYFENPDRNVLIRKEIPVDVEFPVRISNVKTAKQLLLNETNTLSANIKNFSNKDIAGNIEIEIFDNATRKTVVKNWNGLNGLNRSQTVSLKDAEVLIKDQTDAYIPLRFGVIIKQNGVIIGKDDNVLETMAKANYQTYGDNVPVLITNSDVFGTNIFDLIERLGGRKNVSILDTSLNGQLSEIAKNGIYNKTILIYDENFGISAVADAILKNSKNSNLIFLNENGNAFDKIRNLSFLKNATNLPVKISEYGEIKVFYTNNTEAISNSSLVFQTSMPNLETTLKLFQNFKMSADEHLQKLETLFNQNGYFDPTDEQRILAETFNTKMLAEILNINTAYNLSKNKDLPKVIENDKSLFVNKLLAKVQNTPINQNTLGIHLFAVNAIFTLDKAMNKYEPTKANFNGNVEKYVDKIRKAMEGKIKNDLKKNFAEIYKKIYDNEGFYTPFAVK